MMSACPRAACARACRDSPATTVFAMSTPLHFLVPAAAINVADSGLVVADRDGAVALARDGHVHRHRAGVLHRVRERFLNDAVDGQLRRRTDRRPRPRLNATRKPDLVASAMSWGTTSGRASGVRRFGTRPTTGRPYRRQAENPGPCPPDRGEPTATGASAPASRGLCRRCSPAPRRLVRFGGDKRPPSACAMTAVREWATISCISRAMRVRSAIAASSARSRGRPAPRRGGGN